MERISKIIREVRLAKGYTQERLAVKAGITTRTLLSMEGGKACNIYSLLAICDALGLDIIIREKKV